jgi:hypothetical protein
MCWLADCVIEGFAAYANGFYPWHHDDDRWLEGDAMQSERLDHRIASPVAPSVDAALSRTVAGVRRSTGGGE